MILRIEIDLSAENDSLNYGLEVLREAERVELTRLFHPNISRTDVMGRHGNVVGFAELVEAAS